MDNNNKGEGMSMDELAPHFNRIDQELSLLKALSERRETTKHTVGCRDACGWVHFKEQEIKRINESHAKAIAHHHELHRQSLSQCNELKVEMEKLTKMLYERAEHHLEHHQELYHVETDIIAKLNETNKELKEENAEKQGRLQDCWGTLSNLERENSALNTELSRTRETLHGRIHDLSTDNLRLRTAIKEFSKDFSKHPCKIISAITLFKIAKEGTKQPIPDEEKTCNNCSEERCSEKFCDNHSLWTEKT